MSWPFYALGRLFDGPDDDWFAVRFTAGLALPAAAVVIHYGYRLLRLFGCRGASLVGGVALLLVTPLLFISTYGAEADILVTAVLAAFLFHLTRYAAHPSAARTGDVVLIGVLAGLAAATKYNGLVAVVSAGLVFARQLLDRPDRRRTCIHGALVLVVCVGVGGWKYWDNSTRYGHALHANGSAAEGLSIGARDGGSPYEFSTLRLAEASALFGRGAPLGTLTDQPVYQSVPTTLHMLTWSDMSFFSIRSRHGLESDPYPFKRIPVALIMTVVVLGFVPEALALLGVVATVRRRAFFPLAAFSLVTCAAYLWWLLPQDSWALKPKYVLCLLPPAVVYAMVGQAWLVRRAPVVGMAVAGLLGGLVVAGHIYSLCVCGGPAVTVWRLAGLCPSAV